MGYYLQKLDIYFGKKSNIEIRNTPVETPRIDTIRIERSESEVKGEKVVGI